MLNKTVRQGLTLVERKKATLESCPKKNNRTVGEGTRLKKRGLLDRKKPGGKHNNRSLENLTLVEW